MSSASTYIKISGLYKVFGSNSSDGVTKLKAGISKDELMSQYQLSVGLSDISLDIEKGETFVVMGLSGSGKSTLIRHFNRLIEPTEGTIEIDGIDICSLDKKQIQDLRRHKMSMVFQRFGLLPHRTVIQNVAYGLKIQGVNKLDWQSKAQHWIDIVGLTGYENQYPNQLSGGQQQRVGLARALCTDPDILLMDEAFSALDPLIRSEMQQQLKDLQQKLHKTIIFITHDLDEALRLGDRVAILKDGQLIQQGKPVDILLNPATDYVASFVKDINRGRALTVKHAYTAQNAIQATSSIRDAISHMQQTISTESAVVDGEHQYIGLIRLVELQAMMPSTPERYVRDVMSPQSNQPMLSIDQTLESVMPEVLDSNQPLPVQNMDGKYAGMLDKKLLATLLGGR
ncbi:quaternary amine ABC transporter ATP-binding protein [Vibrio rumoiensis]|uniref:quaternary amine ABC transporter ATP-binding protein n=1 Tax=Vibrio rumoiensis TaxID=76258 RepID=UPI000B5C89FF|nr:betaine/proline/choline family ABC transporter ATP-binding protein [Vibrio rumoiensis]